jgi:Protein of unknown function (DUF1691)
LGDIALFIGVSLQSFNSPLVVFDTDYFVYTVTRTQKYSSYVFTTFLGMHITNTALLPLITRSVPDADTYLLLTRPYYQSSVAEPLIVALPLLAHVASGLALRIQRKRLADRRFGYLEAEKNTKTIRSRWPTLSYTSLAGWILYPMVVGHVIANRLTPLRIEGGSSGVGLSFVAHGFAKHPLFAWAGYGALIGVGSWHFVWGWSKWLGLDPSSIVFDTSGKKRSRRWWGINAVSALTAAIWMAGGLGVVGRGGLSAGWVGKGFDGLYRSIPVVGKWM